MKASFTTIVVGTLLVAATGRPLAGQGAGAAELHQLVRGLTVTPRVLIIAARPEDADAPFVAWLSRGRQIHTGVFSLTRGEAAANFVGSESGIPFGAVRTQELLAARRIDGAEQFFGRAIDFGVARDTTDVFTRWPHDSLLGDIVAVIRSFRPHVIVTDRPDPVEEHDGQRVALYGLVREAFGAAANATRFSARFGEPWLTAKLYDVDVGLQINTDELDPVFGKTYPALAEEARARQRSQGLLDLTATQPSVTRLRLAASRVGDTTVTERTMFDGVDTTLARLAIGAPNEIAVALRQLVAAADSARMRLDLAHPDGAVPYLARVAGVAGDLRRAAAWCRHPARNTAPPAIAPASCDQAALDLDASIDLVQRRATDALLGAAGVVIAATADRELVAASDSARLTITVSNYGPVGIVIRDVAVWGSAKPPLAQPVSIAPQRSAQLFHKVGGLASAHPWWMTKPVSNRFTEAPSAADGLARGDLVPPNMLVPSVAVPETIRRTSDATLTLTVAGATVTTSVGPFTWKYADATLGVQRRPIAGMPDVTLQFDHALEWVRARTTIDRGMRVVLRSFSDRQMTFAPHLVSPEALRVDSLPKSFTLAPHEQREIILRVRGRLEPGGKEAFGLAGIPKTGEPYTQGFQLVQAPEELPVRIARSSGLWLQPVDVTIPADLTVAYVRGVGDVVGTALKQIDVPTVVIPAAELINVDLSKVSTVVIGPRAVEANRDLYAHGARLLEFVRRGGTLVVLRGEHGTAESPLLPFPATVRWPNDERVVQPTAPVVAVEPRSRVLSWPNAIRASDWAGWTGERALFVPTSVDERYTQVIETHDPQQPENRNALLVARVGKGAFVYTTLTLDRQIASGVPGAMRLLVNLISAGLKSPE